MSDTRPLITVEQFTELFHRAERVAEFVMAINMQMPTLPIPLLQQRAAFLIFLTNTSYESNRYTAFEENLDLSRQELLKQWSWRFAPADAIDYEHNPERIANRIYSQDFGNGDEASGDGWKYRGRGTIKLRGKVMYRDFAHSHNMLLEEGLQYILTPAGIIAAAVWQWRQYSLMRFTTRNRLITVTQMLSGSSASNAERLEEFDRIAAGLAEPVIE
jgi:putative chitinase